MASFEDTRHDLDAVTNALPRSDAFGQSPTPILALNSPAAVAIAIHPPNIVMDEAGGGPTAAVGCSQKKYATTVDAAHCQQHADTHSNSGEDYESLESDYYYDDEGQSHTYYRPRRYRHHRLLHAEANQKGAFDGLPNDNEYTDIPTTAVAATDGGGAYHKSPSLRAVNYPVDNGPSIYIAPLGAPPSHSAADGNGAAGALAENGGEGRGTKADGADDKDDVEMGPPHAAGAAVVTNSSIVDLPYDHLRHLGDRLDKLPIDELLYISAMASRKAHREVYSVLQYSGEAWYLPEVRRTRPGEKRWEFMYYWGIGLIISIAGRRMRLRLLSYTLRILLMVLIWYVVWASPVPKSWSYRAGYFLDPYATVMVSAIVGGIVCRILQIPPLVGVLWMGVVWNNIGPEVGYFTQGILPELRLITSRSGLTVIVLRAGYSINAKSIKPLIGNVFLNASTYVVEAMAHTLMAQYFLKYDDWKWSLCQGFIGAVPAAAIVVPGALLLQAEGYSRASGPLPLMLATMGVETPVGIWVSNFLYGLISTDQDIGFLAGMGPVQIVGGLVVGFIAAAAVHFFVWLLRNEANRLPTGKYAEAHLTNTYNMSLVVLLLVGHALMFTSYHIDLAGGGVVATLSLTFFLANYWGRNPADTEWMDIKSNIATRLASAWDLAAMPYLFAIAGSKIVFSNIFNATMFPKALLTIVVSIAARFLFTGVGSLGLGFTWQERLFHMGAATSKATLQIAMGSSPLDMVTKKIKALPETMSLDDPIHLALLKQQDNALVFQSTLVLSVMICAPLAAVWITRVGPKALKRE